MTDIKTELAQATRQLTGVSASASLDAEILLGFVLNRPRAYLYSHPEIKLNAIEGENYQQLLMKRHSGWPIAYLIGIREFWSLPLRVNSNTLIPRPETELLVELTLSLFGNKPYVSVLDLGT